MGSDHRSANLPTCPHIELLEGATIAVSIARLPEPLGKADRE
jgi:hypothetical protein